jgi:ABC-2 type transport system permease protein
MFLVIFNGIFGESDFFVPAIAAFSVITACYTNISIGITLLRDEGVLKKLRGTPLPPAAYILGRVLHASFLALLLVAIIAVAGALFYGVDLPTDTMAKFLLTLVVGAGTFCALGLALTPAIPNAEAAPAIVNASILPLAFVSDIFVPADEAPDWLQTIGDFFPLKHYSEAMQASFNPLFEQWEWTDLLFVAIWGIAGVAVALKFFTWEPKR